MTRETKTRYTLEDNENLSKVLEDLLPEMEIRDEIAIGEQVWRILEKKGGWTRIWLCRGPGRDIEFDGEGSNDYEKSSIRKYLHGDFRKTIPHGLLQLTHGNDFDLLSKEEVEEFMPEEIQRIFCDERGETWWWWTRSALRTNATNVWYVNASGAVGNLSACNAIRCAPSVLIK